MYWNSLPKNQAESKKGYDYAFTKTKYIDYLPGMGPVT